jgi:hypothetical protein
MEGMMMMMAEYLKDERVETTRDEVTTIRNECESSK